MCCRNPAPGKEPRTEVLQVQAPATDLKEILADAETEGHKAMFGKAEKFDHSFEGLGRNRNAGTDIVNKRGCLSTAFS